GSTPKVRFATVGFPAATGDCSRRRVRAAPATRGIAGALRRSPANLSEYRGDLPPGGQSPAGRRAVLPARSGGDVAPDRTGGEGWLLSGDDGAIAGGGDATRRRADHGYGPRRVRCGLARRHRLPVPRSSGDLDAAVLLRRSHHGGTPQYPGGIRPTVARLPVLRAYPSLRRSLQTSLRGPQRLPRGPRFRASADRTHDLERLRRGASPHDL